MVLSCLYCSSEQVFGLKENSLHNHRKCFKSLNLLAFALTTLISLKSNFTSTDTWSASLMFTRVLLLWGSGSFFNCFFLLFNSFVPNVPFFYPLKALEKRKVFWCFQGVEKGYIGNIWIKISYLAAPRPTLGHWQDDKLTHSMLITACFLIRPKGHREPRNRVGSGSPAKGISGIQNEKISFWQ